MGPASLWVVLGGVFMEGGAFKRYITLKGIQREERSRTYIERIEDLFRESPEQS